MTTLDLPAKMDFTMGSTEQKMDMTLDDIIKQNRKSTTQQRVPNKGRFKNANASARKGASAQSGRGGNGQTPRGGYGQAPRGRYGPGARAAFQRQVAARSSSIRQGKFADARARNGAGNFAATQAAGKRAFTTPVAPRNRYWMKNSDVRRNNFARQRPVFGQKLNPFNASGSNMKISVVNNGSKGGVPRFSGVSNRRRNVLNAGVHQVLNEQDLDRMDVDHAQPQVQKQKGRTLDSLFAEMKERRNSQHVVQPFAAGEHNNSRRGRGRSGYQGRRI